MKGLIRHLFPGGNTSEGFHSFYQYILPQETANKIICIKGGPGTGKSSLMKKVGNYFNEKGYDIEFHHCSSDNDSLDALVIPTLKVAILDGTSPHMVDPKNPGAVDEILNLGQFWDEDGFIKDRNKIINLNKSIGLNFSRAYKYIEAAKLMYDSWSSLNFMAMDISKVNLIQEEIKNEILKTAVCDLGHERHLFASAFTPNGIITYVDNLYQNYKTVYVLNGEPGTCKSVILKYIKEEALKRGHDVEIFHKPLIPNELEHLLIPSLSTAILTSNEINKQEIPGIQVYTNQLQNHTVLNDNLYKIQEERENFYLLLNKGLNIISNSKKLHDELETYYIPNMDFDKMDNVYNEVLNKFLKYAKSNRNKTAFKQVETDLYFV